MITGLKHSIPAILLGLFMLVPAVAMAGDVAAPYRGSGVTLRTTVSALSFDAGAEPDYNPYIASTVDLAGMWWFADWLNTSARIGFTRELTHSDVTTDADEVWPSDLFVTVGSPRFANVPLLDIDLSASLGTQIPTSPVSQARTLNGSVTPTLSARRSFDILGGLGLGYSYRATRYFHGYTTGSLQAPRIPGCVGAVGGCDSFLNTGVRNVRWRQVHGASISLGLVDTLAVSASTSVVIDDLYEGVEDARVSYVPQVPTDTRHSIAYGLGASYSPMPSLTLSIGAATSHAQLGPDSTYRTPFFNRNTTIYFDLGLDVAGVVSQVSP
jgi:hypothetical protein